MIEFYKVDVFTDVPLKGNPAAVVLGTFDRSIMQALAFELNVSETVFVDGFRLRFFTPSTEVDLCGHATLGAFHVLRMKGLKDGRYTAVTNAGNVEVEVGDILWLRVATPKLLKENDRTIVDVGIRIGLKEVEDFETLMSLKPSDAEKWRNVVGVLFYTLDSNYDACTRFFAPAVGIPEDPVTGTANSALGFYLRKSGKLVKDFYVFEQGHALGREGIVHVRLDDGVWVGGKAVCVAKGVLMPFSDR